MKISLVKIFMLSLLAIGFAGACNVTPACAQDEAATANQEAGLVGIGAGLGAGVAMGLCGVGAAWGLGTATSAIAAAGAEKPELIMRFFIYIVFIEAIAIYGLIVSIFSIMILPTI